MIRNRRSRVAVRFPPRKAAIYSLELSPAERRLYDNVTAYIREKLQQDRIAADTKRKSTGFLRMTLMTLQKELCSSPQAVARTLKKMVDRQTDPDLVEQLVLAWGIPQGRKVEATLSILEQHPGKFLIFTDYLPTLHALGHTLQAAGYQTVLFHGGMSALERVEAVRTFQRSARVMISTRSGGEGHNLQFCHQMINFDLPWNPMRIEQRVGRLHRLGQQEPVTIFNLAATNTIEAYLLDLLAHKIRMFELVIGELDLILGELGDERSFERYIEAAWADSQSEAELAQMVAELEKILAQAQVTYQEIRSASDELSDLIDAFDEVVC
jgi:SNF2 family DNA or RNA helicase